MDNHHKEDLDNLVASVKRSPAILKTLISSIPEEQLKVRRIPGKWSIHEHAVHLQDAQNMIYKRFERFRDEKNPQFVPFFPNEIQTDSYLLEMDLNTTLAEFESMRKNLIEMVQTFSPDQWQNEGTHPEYRKFNPHIFLRHVLMHDHIHMYRIEELWLTEESFLRKN